MRVEGGFRQVCLQRKELPDCSGDGGGRLGYWEELEEDQWWEELATKEPKAGLGSRGLTVLQVGVLRCETTWWLTWEVAKGPSPPRFSGFRNWLLE